MTRIGVAANAIHDARWSEMRDMGWAQLALLRAQVMRWARPVGGLVEVAGEEPAAEVFLSDAQLATCQRLADAVDRASRYGLYRPRCLARAVALSQMLDTHGIAGHRIRIGVRREHEVFAAHAWVELGPLILGEPIANTAPFMPLAHVTVAGK